MLPLAWFVLLSQDQAAGNYASRIAHRLSPSAEVRFVNDPDVRATMIRGGRIDLSTGLFARLRNEAELAAIRALTKAGYDPGAMLEFFSKYRREGENLTTAYSAEDLLIEKLQLEATDHPLKDAVVNTPDFDRAHESMK